MNVSLCLEVYSILQNAIRENDPYSNIGNHIQTKLIMLPYKDQKSSNILRKQMADLSRKINADISPVYTSRKIKDEIKIREDKPPLVSQQCVVYSFQCGLCDAGYVGYMCQHLHQRIEKHNTNVVTF